MRPVVPIREATVAVNAALVPDPEPEPEQATARSEGLVESYRRLAAVFHDVLSEQSPEALLDRIAETLADEIAAAAELVMGKTERVPVAVVRGLDVAGDGTGRELVMPPELDLFR